MAAMPGHLSLAAIRSSIVLTGADKPISGFMIDAVKGAVPARAECATTCPGWHAAAVVNFVLVGAALNCSSCWRSLALINGCWPYAMFVFRFRAAVCFSLAEGWAVGAAVAAGLSSCAWPAGEDGPAWTLAGSSAAAWFDGGSMCVSAITAR